MHAQHRVLTDERSKTSNLAVSAQCSDSGWIPIKKELAWKRDFPQTRVKLAHMVTYVYACEEVVATSH